MQMVTEISSSYKTYIPVMTFETKMFTTIFFMEIDDLQRKKSWKELLLFGIWFLK
jgi:hypothetical protein